MSTKEVEKYVSLRCDKNDTNRECEIESESDPEIKLVDNNKSSDSEIEEDMKLKYSDASEWLNDDIILEPNDIRNVFKYSKNLYDLSEISFNCDFCDDSNDDCFSGYEEKCHEKLKILKIFLDNRDGNNESMICINKIMKNSPQLEHISLADFIFKDGCIKSLLKDVNLSKIVTIELHNNYDENLRICNEFKNAISEFTNLNHLIIDSISCDDIIEILCSLTNKKNLTSLELCSCLNDVNAKLNIEIGKLSELKEFNFSSNSIMKNWMIDLINKLPMNIETLYLNENYNSCKVNNKKDMVSNGIEKLIYRNNENLKRLSLVDNGRFVISNHEIISNLSKFSELIEFRFDNNGVGEVDINELCKNIKKLSKLEIVSLNNCDICNKGFEELCNSLCNVKRLKELYISGNKISDIRTFIKNMEKYECLECLDICGEYLKSKNIIELMDGMLKLDSFKILKIDKIRVTENENEEIKKKMKDMKEKEISIKEIIIEDKIEKVIYSKNYVLSYEYGFKCGFNNLKFEDYYNGYDEEDALNGFQDGYIDGSDYRQRECSKSTI